MRKFRPTLILLLLMAVVAGVAALQPGAEAKADPPGQRMMYWTDGGTNKIQRANIAVGPTVYDLVAPPDINYPSGIALDVAAGKMYWTDQSAQKIQRADLDGGNVEDLLTSADGLVSPTGIALDVGAGKMYWADYNTEKIQRADMAVGPTVEDLVTTGLLGPNGIALDVGAGTMYWTDGVTNKIQRADMADGSNVEDLVTSGLSFPAMIELDVAAGKMYWTDFSTSKVQRGDMADGGNVEDLVIGLVSPFGLALDVGAGKMYWTDYSTHKIQRADMAVGPAVEDLVTGLSNPWDIALDLGGIVRAGYDLLETDPDPANTWKYAWLPADFFGPGSDPFDGIVGLQGVPIDTYTPPGAPTFTDLGPTDTIVERREDAGEEGFPETIEIEIVALNLVSAAPITVTYMGGMFPEQWDVTAVVPENDPNQYVGNMTIRHEWTEGGTFDSYLPVNPQLTFTRIPDGMTVGPIYWADFAAGPIEFFSSDEPWNHTANPLVSPAGNWVIEKHGLTSNFFPGVIMMKGDVEGRFKQYFGEIGTGALHTVRVAEELETNYKCYEIWDMPLGWLVTLETQFGTELVEVWDPAYLCPPAQKDGYGDMSSPHLKCYNIISEGAPGAVVDLETQFGLEEEVAVGEGRLLCTPAAKEVVFPFPEPPGPLVESPQYECFEIEGDPPGFVVDLWTQFGFEVVPVEAARYLCAPAVVDGFFGDLDEPHLKCYEIWGPPPGFVVILETIFGPELFIDVWEARLLCVPATKVVYSGPDRDADGVPDVTDNCPDWPNPSQALPAWYPPAGVANDLDCDRVATGKENFMVTVRDNQCAADNTPNNEGPPDRWPFDFDDSQMANLADVLSYIPVFNTFPPNPPSTYDPRYDLNADNGITLADVLSFIPVFNQTCSTAGP